MCVDSFGGCLFLYLQWIIPTRLLQMALVRGRSRRGSR